VLSLFSGRFVSALFTLIVCCTIAAPEIGAASSAGPAPPASEAGAAQVLSANEALFLAQTLLGKGQADEAEKVYTSLRLAANEEIRIEAAFQLAHIYLRQGRYRPAISLFLEILNRQPNLARVRLDLARAYFLDKNYEDAAFQFELVKGGDLPPEVLANVDMFLDAIRRQKNWTLDFSFSPVSDSNLNQASGGKEECIDTIFGTLCRPLGDKAGGLGLSANATADYFWRFHQDWGLKATLGFYGTFYEQNEFDDYSVYAALGPRYLWESGEASLQPTLRKRWFGGRQYSDELGLRLDARQIYGRIILNGGAALAFPRYTDAYANDLLKGSTWNIYLQPRYILTDRTFIQPGLSFLREDTEARAYANDNWRYALGGYHAFPYGISLFVEGSLTDTRYQAPQWYVTRDHLIDETVREDKTWQLFSSLSSNIFEKYNITPVLQYTYTKRDSNIWIREYERHRVNFMFNYKL
jgi:tetratricopeptide (TPR) repeat protein